MNSIEKLVEIFAHFPGIGPRQARRFVYYLLTRTNSTLEELAKHIKELKDDAVMCGECQRFYASPKAKIGDSRNICPICSDQNRDHSLLMLVQRDSDLESMEKNGNFGGVYFVLGGSVPILEKEPEKRIRIKELKEYINRKGADLKEVILGVNWNPEGENTADYVKKILKDNLRNIKISSLGKGLSMGTELEYADSDTLRNALKNRG